MAAAICVPWIDGDQGQQEGVLAGGKVLIHVRGYESLSIDRHDNGRAAVVCRGSPYDYVVRVGNDSSVYEWKQIALELASLQ